MGARRKGRELALQALYQVDLTEDSSAKALNDLSESFDSSPGAREFAWSLVRGVHERREQIDSLIAAASQHWRLERLSRVDTIVMRIAVHEMTNPPELPVEIAVNEALEVVKKFGSTESASFVNGILDEVARRVGRKAAPLPNTG